METAKTVPVIPVAAAQPVQAEMGQREEPRRELGAEERQPAKLQAEMGRQPRSISERYQGSGKLKDQARARAAVRALQRKRQYHDAKAKPQQVAIITGADSGIGRAVAVAFAREGCNIVCCYLNEHEDAKQVVEMVAAEGSHAIALAGDVALPEFAEDAVQKTLNAFGRIDILVNNAGVQYLHDSIKNITHKQLFDTFAVNVYAAFFMAQACLPHMRRGGAIINTSSVAAYKGRPDMLDYSAAKGALISFTYSLAASPEVLEKNIRVNAVAPGHTISPMVEATYSGDKIRGFGKDTPMGRPAQPEEIAPSYVFLASDIDSSFMSGQVLHPNGGMAVHG